jgi:hypothetical protein
MGKKSETSMPLSGRKCPQNAGPARRDRFARSARSLACDAGNGIWLGHRIVLAKLDKWNLEKEQIQ